MCAGWMCAHIHLTSQADATGRLQQPCPDEDKRPLRPLLPSVRAGVLSQQGEVIGEVRQRWHLWRRKYDLFLGRRQFAAIDGGLLAWEFELKDAAGNTLALIDRCVWVCTHVCEGVRVWGGRGREG